jgi:uncharacterized protein YdaU (DUF1376 family)
MYYYSFNIGDYRKDTVHLSRLEHSIYRDLIDWYYLDESPIPLETQSVSRRLRLATEEEANALLAVLQDFFLLSEDGWRHKRIDSEIAEYHAKCETNRTNGKAGGRPRVDKNPVGSQSQPSRNPNHKPITNNHKPIKTNTAPEGVSLEVWDSFVQQRQKQRAVVTETVIKTIQKEADLADWPLEKALSEIVARGWRGFKAEWVKDKQENKLLTFAERDEQLKKKKWEEMTGRKWPEPGQPAERLLTL